MNKEILYYNPKQKCVGVKRQLPVGGRAKGLVQILMGEKPKMEWKEAKATLVEGDKFDLEIAYALCVLEICAGSKRSRDKILKAHYGELLNTPAGYKTALISTILNSSHMTYEGLKKHIRDITSDKDWEVLSKM